METKGIYHFNNEEYEASFSLLKDKLCIALSDNKKVFWYYEQIKREGLYNFTYADYPPQVVQLSSSTFADALAIQIQKGTKRPNAGKIAPLLKVLLVFIFLILLAYFLLVPWIATALASRFPVNYEKTIGDQAFASMKKSFVIDQNKTNHINDFFRRLNIPSQYDIHITVVKGDVINAFAMPGGHIVVYDKLLYNLGSYPELAALLAHEFTHVENRHTVRSLFRALSSKVFLSLIVGDATAVGAVIIDNADELKSLSYSRRLEKEADENGARLLAERNIDCAGFVRLFQVLKKETKGVETTEWISSHPNLDKRIENIRENAFCKGNTPKTDDTLRHIFLQLQTAD